MSIAPMMQNKIYIVHKRLEKIPPISECITEVDLRRNNISEMSLNRAESVEYLDLSDNKITLMSNLENKPNLKILDLSYNLITRIEIPRMGIEELYLISNDITEIHELDLSGIRKLDMAVNCINRIENLEKCSTLEELYLGGNKINIIEGVECLSRLKVLDLQNNDLEVVDCKVIPKSVETLLLGENGRLKSIKNIKALENLKILGLEKTDIPRDVVQGSFVIWY